MKEIILTNEEKESYEKQKNCYICEKEFCTDKNNKKEFKSYHKFKDHCHYTGKIRGAAHSCCNLRYKIPKDVPIVFQNGSTYDYHFIIKQLAKELKGNFDCLGENGEKCITFSAPIKKELHNDKANIYKLKFIDSYRFMLTSSSSLVNNLSEINNKECKKCAERNKIRSEFEFIGPKDNRLKYKGKECNNISYKSVNKLIEKFASLYQFCNKDLNKFALLLRKGVYPYEHVDSWERFNEASLPDKESFHSNLKLEDISDQDCLHA